MTREIFTTTQAPAPVAAYSQASAAGSLLAVSGQVGIDPGSDEIVPGGVGPQLVQTLHNLDAVLAAAGASRDDVIRLDCYLTTLDDWDAFNEAYAAEFPGSTPPARTTVVVGLGPGLLVEVTALVVRPSD
jgi:2-iminobutanoate/2-iminopropanoate deaminase